MSVAPVKPRTRNEERAVRYIRKFDRTEEEKSRVRALRLYVISAIRDLEGTTL